MSIDDFLGESLSEALGFSKPPLMPEDCPHKYLRADPPFETGEFDDKGRRIVHPGFTCYHPTLPHCGSTLYGRERISGHNKIERIQGKIYYVKEEKKK